MVAAAAAAVYVVPYWFSYVFMLIFFDSEHVAAGRQRADPVGRRRSPGLLGGRPVPAGQRRVRGQVVKVERPAHEGRGHGARRGLPVDVKLSPDGLDFSSRTRAAAACRSIDPVAMRETDFIPTGAGAHGFCVSRDTHELYVAQPPGGHDLGRRLRDAARGRATWHVGGSPDMMQVSADGRRAVGLEPLRRDGLGRVHLEPDGCCTRSRSGRRPARVDALPAAGALQHRPQRRLPVADANGEP